jgi:hypothetical protein
MHFRKNKNKKVEKGDAKRQFLLDVQTMEKEENTATTKKTYNQKLINYRDRDFCTIYQTIIIIYYPYKSDILITIDVEHQICVFEYVQSKRRERKITNSYFGAYHICVYVCVCVCISL